MSTALDRTYDYILYSIYSIFYIYYVLYILHIYEVRDSKGTEDLFGNHVKSAYLAALCTISSPASIHDRIAGA